MAIQEYSDEVWNRLREVYENSAKISWQKLVDMVGEELGCDMPNSSVVRRKAIKEKWKKKAKHLVKKSAKELNKEIKKLTTHSDGQKDNQDADNKNNSSSQKNVKNTSNLTHFSGQKDNKNEKSDSLKTNMLTASQIIKDNRERLANLGILAGDTIHSVIHIRDEVLKLDMNNLATDPNAETILTGIKFKMGLISQIVDLNVKQSITLTNIAKSEALFWGFELEELKDQSEQQARRTSVIDDAERKLAEAKAAMKEQKRLAFERKLAMIEVGEEEHEDD